MKDFIVRMSGFDKAMDADPKKLRRGVIVAIISAVSLLVLFSYFFAQSQMIGMSDQVRMAQNLFEAWAQVAVFEEKSLESLEERIEQGLFTFVNNTTRGFGVSAVAVLFDGEEMLAAAGSIWLGSRQSERLQGRAHEFAQQYQDGASAWQLNDAWWSWRAWGNPFNVISINWEMISVIDEFNEEREHDLFVVLAGQARPLNANAWIFLPIAFTAVLYMVWLSYLPIVHRKKLEEAVDKARQKQEEDVE